MTGRAVGSLAWAHGASAAAFLVPGLALWLPSGYSHGALLLLLCALGTLPGWWRQPLDGRTRALAAVLAGMAVIWLLDLGPTPTRAPIDRPLKYALALPCLFFVVAAPPRARALWRGLAVGATGSGLLALFQRLVQGMPRPQGFTNAVQYGDLSLLLGTLCLAVLLARWSRCTRGERGALAAGCLLGLLGSVLSQTRGGWVALLLALPAFGVMLVRAGRGRQLGHATLALGAGLLVMGAVQGPQLSHRIALSTQEVAAYLQSGQAATSVGQRLEHWRFAADLGLERPLQGWGSAYQSEKARRVAEGRYHPYIQQFDHAHNELLDMFARKGIPGALMLLLFYGVPMAVFWPTRARAAGPDGAPDPDRLALCLVGVLIPLCYLGFGLTQVFFAHNSGNMMYVFMLLLVQGALAGAGRSPTPAKPER